MSSTLIGPIGTGIDANGFTTFSPTTGSQTIYVSSSTGSDSNNGLSPDSPVKTIAKGLSLLHNGSDDQLLLKAGDTFHESVKWPAGLSGMSASHPIVFSSYGTGPRPVIDSGIKAGFEIYGNPPVNNVAIVGLDFYSGARDPSSPEYTGATTGNTGISILSNSSNILI